jgi:hypothetical protein
MNVINKKHPAIIEAKRKSECYMSVSERQIWISHEAAHRFGLSAGKYLHFLNDGREWSFFQNEDPDGFFLQHNGKPSSDALMITSRPLIRMFLKSTGFKSGTWLYLLVSDAECSGSKVVQIITNKTYKEFMGAHQ